MLEKQKIRERILSKRRSLAKEKWNQMSVRVKEKLFSLDEFEESKTLSLYVAIDNEVLFTKTDILKYYLDMYDLKPKEMVMVEMSQK